LTAGILFALLTAYVYAQANTETFVIYLIALSLWTGLSGYCLVSRRKQSLKAGASLEGVQALKPD
jgi:hypothetical protein